MFSTIFCGSSGLEPGRTGDDFGADQGRDHNLDEPCELRVVVAGETDGKRAALVGFPNRAENVGRATTGGDADDRIGCGDFEAINVDTAGLGAVLQLFDGVGERLRSAGYPSDDQFGRCAEGRRALGCVQYAKPAGGAGAEVDQPAIPAAQAFGDLIDRGGNVRQLGLDGRGDLGILAIHDPGDFERVEAVDICARRVASLS